jgi:hypothetical protein
MKKEIKLTYDLEKRPHGGWSCVILYKKYPIASEGFFTKSLPTMKHVKEWIDKKIATIK